MPGTIDDAEPRPGDTMICVAPRPAGADPSRETADAGVTDADGEEEGYGYGV